MIGIAYHHCSRQVGSQRKFAVGSADVHLPRSDDFCVVCCVVVSVLQHGDRRPSWKAIRDLPFFPLLIT